MDLSSRPGLILAEVFVVAMLILFPIAMDHGLAAAAVDEWQSNLDGGVGILVVSAGERGTLTVADCLATERIDSVVGVGWMSSLGTARLWPVPDLAIRSVGLGGQAPQLLGLSPEPRSTKGDFLILGSLVADTLGLTPESAVVAEIDSSSSAVFTVSGIADGPRAEQLAFSVMTIDGSGSGRIAECWVDYGRPARADDRDLLRHMIGPSVADHVTPLATATGSLILRYESEPFRFLWVVSVLVGATFYWILDWSRRGETAVYRAIGVRRSHLLRMRAWERLLVMSGSLALATGMLAVYAESSLGFVRSVDLAGAAAIALAVFTLSLSTTRTLSDRRLAQLLKDR